jgi:hypothetical protein
VTPRTEVQIRIADGAVTVDDLQVPGTGDDYARAVAYVTAMIAAPHRQLVTALVSDDAMRMHLRVRPDGRIGDLVVLARHPDTDADAAPPAALLALVAPGRARGPVVRTPHLRVPVLGPKMRATTALLAGAVGVGAVSFAMMANAGEVVEADAGESMARSSPSAPGASVTPAARLALQSIVRSTSLDLIPLRLEVVARGVPERLLLVVRSSRVPVTVTVVLTEADGETVRRRVRLEATEATISFDLEPGPVAWVVRGERVAASGRAEVPGVTTVTSPQDAAPGGGVQSDPPPPGQGGPGFDTSGNLPPGQGPVGVNDRKEVQGVQ